jgi:hypothetical protein
MVAAPLFVALWPGDAKENKFGPAPVTLEHIGQSRFNVIAIAGAAAILIPTCIYAGFYQPGVWVGRTTDAPEMPNTNIVNGAVDGFRFMRCWNVKGVAAHSGKVPEGEFFRDDYGDAIIEFFSTPDGQIDISTVGGTDGKSYRSEGYKITSYGLQIPASNLNHFMITAIQDGGDLHKPGGFIDYNTFSFSKNKGHWPPFHMVMSTNESRTPDNLDLIKFPDIFGRLMVGDCAAG